MPSSSAYFDSCIFIELLQQSDTDRFEACEDLRIQAARMDLTIVTSALTIAETQRLPGSKMMSEADSKQILSFFENAYIVIRQVDRQTAEKGHELALLHGLSPNDSIHIATAVIARVPVFYTYDGVGKRKRPKHLLRHNLRIGNPPLRIEIPPKPTAGPLFSLPAPSEDGHAENPAFPPPERADTPETA